jgi:hypothetical protein
MGLLDVGKALQYGLPAVVGAYQAGSAAAEQGQNPLQVLGATALGGSLGAGLGHYGGKFGRMAGEKLAGTKAGQELLGQGSSVMAKSGLLTKLAGGPVAPLTAAGVGGLGALALGQTLPSLAAPIAAGATGLVGNLAKPFANLAATQAGANQATGFQGDPNAVPPSVQQQAHAPTPWEVVDPNGRFAANRLNELKQGDVELENMKKIIPYQYQVMSQAKKDEMQRGMAAAQIKANILTNAQLMLGGAQTAQQMGLNAASQMGSALAAQYQYG